MVDPAELKTWAAIIKDKAARRKALKKLQRAKAHAKKQERSEMRLAIRTR